MESSRPHTITSTSAQSMVVLHLYSPSTSSNNHLPSAQIGHGRMRVVVTGGRFYDDYSRLAGVLDEIHSSGWIPPTRSTNHQDGFKLLPPISALAHGACDLGGADQLADYWADANGVYCEPYPAKRHPRTGAIMGSVRNAKMLELFKPDLVIAFPGGVGTFDCLMQAKSRDIYRLEIDRS